MSEVGSVPSATPNAPTISGRASVPGVSTQKPPRALASGV